MLTVMVVLALMLFMVVLVLGVFVCCVGGGAAVMVDLAVAAAVRVMGYSALHLPSIYGGITAAISSGALLNFSQYICCGFLW